MRIKVSYDDYCRLKQSLEGIEWIWSQYERNCPNEWYLFKYQNLMRLFCERGGANYLMSKVHKSWFSTKVKVPVATYRELIELVDIGQELQDIINNPPYGSRLTVN